MNPGRRRAIIITGAAVATAVPAIYLFSQGGNVIRTIDAAMSLIDRAEQSVGQGLVYTNEWPLAGMFEHLAQSIEYSVTGFPQMKSPLFQQTAGTIAFTAFSAMGRMKHGLTEAIPGAPALAEQNTAAAANRLRNALRQFESYQGQLKPHFAYGNLSKTQYTQAHLMHIANHFEQITMPAK